MDQTRHLGTTDERDTIEPLLESLRRFGSRSIDAEHIDRQGTIPKHVLEGLAEIGVFGTTIPERFGGAGLSLGAACQVVETLSRFDRSVATTVGLHLGLGTRALVVAGSRELQEQYLPDLARGKRIAAFAATEPDAGSDLSGIATKAQISGSEIVVDGAKIYVTNGGFAGLLTVLAATPELGGGRRGRSLIVIDPGSNGVNIGREERKLGLRGSSTASIVFDGVSVPRGNVLGADDGGALLLEGVLALGRTVMAAGCVGASSQAIERAILHVNARKQFGRPLASLEVVERQVAEMEALHFAAAAVVADAVDAVEDPELFQRRSMVAKVLASEIAFELADRSIQLQGGFGFMEESGAPLLLRDARVTRIFEGANDVLATRIGVMEISKCGSRPRENVSASSEQVRYLAGQLIGVWGVRVLGQSAELNRVGRLSILAHANDAALRHAARLSTATARACAEHWLSISEHRSHPYLSPLAPRARVAAIVGAKLGSSA